MEVDDGGGGGAGAVTTMFTLPIRYRVGDGQRVVVVTLGLKLSTNPPLSTLARSAGSLGYRKKPLVVLKREIWGAICQLEGTRRLATVSESLHICSADLSAVTMRIV